MVQRATHSTRELSHSRKADLSPARQQLVTQMQRINFGSIEHLAIVDGDPVLDPLPRFVRELKFGADNGPRPEATLNNFTLKTQVAELFEVLDQLGTGRVERIEIKHGVPFRMVLEGAGPSDA